MINQHRLKLVLHCGTPKTGSTTIQHYLAGSGRRLMQQGILYPHIGLRRNKVPKHQWIVDCLLNEKHEDLKRLFDEVKAQAEQAEAKVVVLSTEGLYNHWHSFSATALDKFQQLLSGFDLKFWCFVREPISFAKSRYVQVVRNGPSPFCPCYATPLSFEDTLAHPWFAQQLDYAGFLKAVEHRFGRESILVSRYCEDNILKEVLRVLSLPTDFPEPFERKHVSISSVATEAIRRMNRMRPHPRLRNAVIATLVLFDNAWLKKRYPFQISRRAVREIHRITQSSVEYLRQQHGIHWD